MGRGSSKISGGSGGGVLIKDIENAELRTVMADIVNDIMKGKTYTYARSQKDGKVIDKSTKPGDVFVGDTVSYRKKSNGSWEEIHHPEDAEYTPDAMARVLAGLAPLTTWKFKKK